MQKLELKSKITSWIVADLIKQKFQLLNQLVINFFRTSAQISTKSS